MLHMVYLRSMKIQYPGDVDTVNVLLITFKILRI